MERISREECVRVYKVEAHFFNELVEAGLIETIIEADTVYIAYERLTHFERLVNWHYDLEINVPGLEVICNLLDQLEQLKRERIYLD